MARASWSLSLSNGWTWRRCTHQGYPPRARGLWAPACRWSTSSRWSPRSLPRAPITGAGRRAGSNQSDKGRRVATDPSGNLFVLGGFRGTADLGGGTLFSAGSDDVFLAKYDSDGNHLWGERFGGTQFDEGYGIAVDLTGHVVISGTFRDTINFGGGNLTSNAGSFDIFVARFDPGGNHVWSKRFGANGEDVGLSVAVDGARNAVVTGYFEASVNFGGGNLTSAGGLDIFVAKFNPTNGSHLWSKRFGDSNNDIAWGVAVDGGGNAVVTGYFRGERKLRRREPDQCGVQRRVRRQARLFRQPRLEQTLRRCG